jgi:hypothetical protein
MHPSCTHQHTNTNARRNTFGRAVCLEAHTVRCDTSRMQGDSQQGATANPQHRFQYATNTPDETPAEAPPRTIHFLAKQQVQPSTAPNTPQQAADHKPQEPRLVAQQAPWCTACKLHHSFLCVATGKATPPPPPPPLPQTNRQTERVVHRLAQTAQRCPAHLPACRVQRLISIRHNAPLLHNRIVVWW